MGADINDDVAGREARRQPILVPYDHSVEYHSIECAVAKPPRLGHEALVATSARFTRAGPGRWPGALSKRCPAVCNPAKHDRAHQACRARTECLAKSGAAFPWLEAATGYQA